MSDYAVQRERMVRDHIAARGVKDERVLAALRRTPRHLFVRDHLRSRAYGDHALPIGASQTISQPYVVARMTEMLEVGPEHSVLEIGTGSGFLTACLAWLGREVTSVEINAGLAERARARLASAGRTNAKVEVADAVTAFEPGREFDCVCVTGAMYAIPEKFKRWLRVGGRLFAVRGEGPAMQAMLVTRTNENEFSEQNLFETELAYLINAEPPKRFVF